GPGRPGAVDDARARPSHARPVVPHTGAATMSTPRLIAGLAAIALLGTAGPAAAPPADIVGTWKVLEGSQPNIEEVWIFQIEDGEWKVTGLFYKGREEIGACRGEKIVLKGGGRSFRRGFDKKPAPNYGE